MGEFRLRKSNTEKGSITVEASIVTPVVLLSIIAVILAGLLLYQRALMQSVADRAIEAGALTWENTFCNIATGRIKTDELSDSGLYWRLFETDKEEKKAKVKGYAEELLKKNNILKPESSSVSVSILDFAVYKRLELTIENTYRLPGGSVLRLFGSGGKFKLNISSCVVVNDAAELIRNTDFLLNTEKELEDRYPGLKDLGDKTRGVFSKVKDGIVKFMD